ncbi:MAG: transcriptional regulator [Bacteroidetes bacterium]|nr:transcriptional regulator [Bacteroidota bacterium]
MRRPLPYLEAVSALEAQLKAYEAEGYKKGIMESKLQLAVVNLDFGNIQTVTALLDDCEAFFAKYGSMEQKGLVLFAKGRLYSYDGKFEEGLLTAIKALHHFLPTDIYEYTAKCYVLCGIQCRHLNMYNECLDYMNKGVEASLKAGIKGLTAMCMQNVNEVKMDLLPTGEAIKSLNEFLKYLEVVYEGKDSHPEANALLCLSELYLYVNDLDKAKEVFQRAVDLKQRLGTNAREIDYMNRRGEIAAAEGDEKQMLYHTQQAIDMADIQCSMHGERWSHTIRFDFYIAKGNTARAKKHLDQVHNVLKKKSPSQIEKKVYPLFVKYYHATGDLKNELKYIQLLHKQDVERQQQLTTSRLRHATAIHEVELKDKENEIMKKELNLKSQELNLTNHYLQHRNELLNDLKECINSLKSENSKRETVFQTLFKKIDTAYAKEDNEKDLFKQKFDATHTEFIKNISKTYPTLSPSECRICALMNTGFTNKEIATLLSTTLRNVETHRLNIRKKLKLKRADNLQLILAAVKG